MSSQSEQNYSPESVKKEATYMPILLLQDTITRAFEEGEFALGLFLDLKKAFDTVNINILLEKLREYGISHKAHKMLSSYLSSRTQKVNIRNIYSAYKDITIGVPQGQYWVLSCSLFTLMTCQI